MGGNRSEAQPGDMGSIFLPEILLGICWRGPCAWPGLGGWTPKQTRSLQASLVLMTELSAPPSQSAAPRTPAPKNGDKGKLMFMKRILHSRHLVHDITYIFPFNVPTLHALRQIR